MIAQAVLLPRTRCQFGIITVAISTYGGKEVEAAAHGSARKWCIPILPSRPTQVNLRAVPDSPGPPVVPFAVRSPGIDFDTASCATALIGGHVDVQDDPGNILRISYDECGESSATYNGDMLPVPPPEV